MRILGIDPGIAIVGFGLIESNRGSVRMLQYGAVTTEAGLPLATRLVQIENDMTALIAQLKPDEIAVEELFFSKNTPFLTNAFSSPSVVPPVTVSSMRPTAFRPVATDAGTKYPLASKQPISPAHTFVSALTGWTIRIPSRSFVSTCGKLFYFLKSLR